MLLKKTHVCFFYLFKVNLFHLQQTQGRAVPLPSVGSVALVLPLSVPQVPEHGAKRGVTAGNLSPAELQGWSKGNPPAPCRRTYQATKSDPNEAASESRF